MFFSGSLQEALASAVQDSKAVLCFVTDDGEESQLWESSFLGDDSVASAIRTNAVALRLEAGSQEAGYLAAIFPIPKFPTVVVLRDGELKEYVATGTTKADFAQRVMTALGKSSQQLDTSPTEGESATPAISATPTTEATQSTPSESAVNHPVAPASSNSEARQPGTSDTTQSATGSGTSAAVDAVLAERAARLNQQREEAKRKALEAYAKAKAKGKERADPDADGEDISRTPSQQSFVDAVKKKQREAVEERKRILKRIEDDKAARRALAVEKASARQASNEASTPPASAPSTSVRTTGTMTAIMVRLADGSTLRSRFANTCTIRQDIRKWVDSDRKDGGGAQPYRFRVALSPTSTRLIDDTEEDMDMLALGLAPSATLILVPVEKHVVAYAGGAGGIISAIASPFVWVYTMLAAFFMSLIRRGPASAPSPDTSEKENESRQQQQQGRSTGSRVQTLHGTEQRRRDQQLYNGNSLNFEPRPDDEK